MNNIKNIEIEDILIASVDELAGFLNTISAVFPQSDHNSA